MRETVERILAEIEAARRHAAQFDDYHGEIVLSAEQIAEARENVPQKLKDDIRFAHNKVRRFAQAQRASLVDFSLELLPGLTTGQRAIPCNSVGCYIPGGRYAHVASAIMTVTTAAVAGCQNIIAYSPPSQAGGLNPAIVYAADLSGARRILALGGVQGIAALAFGLFGGPAADILVGPGNQFVAEAERILFGRVGSDMVAGSDRQPDPRGSRGRSKCGCGRSRRPGRARL